MERERKRERNHYLNNLSEFDPKFCLYSIFLNIFHLQSGQVQLHTFVFNLSSHKACKHLWKCAIEHHTFFRLKYHKPRIAKASQLFRLGSTFRYR